MGIVHHVLDRKIGIGTIPNRCWYLVIAAPGQEMLSVISTTGKQEIRLRKVDRIAPDTGKAPARLVDKVAKILGPAAIKIGEEDHALIVLQHLPAGKVDRRNAHELATYKQIIYQSLGKQHQ